MKAIYYFIFYSLVIVNISFSQGEQELETSDGVGLYYEKGQHKGVGDKKGAVILTHGILEHSGRYMEFVHKLNKNGYNTYRYDLRGHGKSEGDKGHVDSFEEFVKDLDRMVDMVIEQEGDNTPIYLFGHSMGGLITFLYSQENQLKVSQNIKGIVLSAPGINIDIGFLGYFKLNFGRFWRMFIDPKKWANQPINRSLLTVDEKKLEEHKNDGLITEDLTISLGIELVNASLKAQDLLESFSMDDNPPFYFIQGDMDSVVNAKENLEIATIISKEENIHIIEGGLHESLNAIPEVRGEAMDNIVNFLDKL